jgi:hypothetical protein
MSLTVNNQTIPQQQILPQQSTVTTTAKSVPTATSATAPALKSTTSATPPSPSATLTSSSAALNSELLAILQGQQPGETTATGQDSLATLLLQQNDSANTLSGQNPDTAPDSLATLLQDESSVSTTSFSNSLTPPSLLTGTQPIGQSVTATGSVLTGLQSLLDQLEG